MKKTVSILKIKKSCGQICQILKALSHPQRLIIMGHLLAGAKTVSELTVACGVSQSQVSQFLIRMKFEGLVKSEKKGKYQVYSVADKRLIGLMKAIQQEYCFD